MIKAFKSVIRVKKIKSEATQGVEFLEDLRLIEKAYGLSNTYSFAAHYLDFEQYSVLT